MTGVAPDPEHVVRAWELHCEGRSLATIREILQRELKEKAPRSRETIRSWVKQGRAAAAWLDEDEKSENYTGPEHVRAKLATFMDELIAMGKDELKADGSYEKIAPIMMRAAIEQARALGGYAALRIHHEGNGSPPAPDAGTQAVIDVLNGRHGQLLSGEEP
jgi:hypothetical protein